MKKLFLSCLLVLLFSPILAGVTVRLDCNTSFMYRGIQLQDKAVLQPSLFSFNDDMFAGIIANYNLDLNEYTEVDFIVGLTQKVSGFNTTLTGTMYQLKGWNDTADFALGLNHSKFSAFNLLGAYDFVDLKGYYAEAYLVKDLALNKKFTLSPRVGVGYNGAYMREANGMSHAYGQSALAYTLTEHASLSLLGYRQEKLNDDFLSVTMGQLSFIRNF